MQTPVYQDWAYPADSVIHEYPAGTAAGDPVVLILYPVEDTSTWGQPSLTGWQPSGSLFDGTVIPILGGLWLGNRAWIYWRRRGGGFPWIGLRKGRARLIGLPGAAGIGRVRVGRRSIDTRAGGGALVISEIGTNSNPTADFTGATLLGPELSVTIKGYPRLRSRTAWADSVSGGVVGVESEAAFTSASDAVTLEVLPPTGPLPPLVLTPQNGQQVSSSGDLAVAFQHRSHIPGGKSDAYRVRAKLVAASDWEYWSLVDGELVAPETSNVVSDTTASIPVSEFTADEESELQVATRDETSGQWSEYSGSVKFTPVTPPSATITSSATWSEDLTPTLTWNPDTPQGAQEAFRAAYEHSGTALHDSRWVSGSVEQFTPPASTAWPNGSPVQLSLYIRQTGGSESAAITQTITVSWTPPTTPAVSVQPGFGQGVLVQVVADAGSLVTVERLTVDEPNAQWVRLHEAVPYPASGALIVADVLAPFQRPVKYRAMATRELEGQVLPSEWGESQLVISEDHATYLVNAQDHTDWLRCTLVTEGAEEDARLVTVTYGRGASRPMVDYGVEQGVSGQMVLSVESLAALDELRAWLRSPRSMFLRRPPRDGVDQGVRRFALTGLTTDLVAESTMVPDRQVTFPWVEQ